MEDREGGSFLQGSCVTLGRTLPFWEIPVPIRRQGYRASVEQKSRTDQCPRSLALSPHPPSPRAMDKGNHCLILAWGTGIAMILKTTLAQLFFEKSVPWLHGCPLVTQLWLLIVLGWDRSLQVGNPCAEKRGGNCGLHCLNLPSWPVRRAATTITANPRRR